MISLKIPKESELHKKISQALNDRHKAANKELAKATRRWKAAEELFIGYIPESDQDALRNSRRENKGKQDYTTIQLPYTYAVAMAAHSYWSTVFLSRNPVFQFMGLNDEGEMQVQAVEAMQYYQVVRGKMLPPLYIWLQDVPKYGEAWVSTYWKTETVRYSEIVQVPDTYLGMVDTGTTKKVRRITESIGYQGNALYNVEPAKVMTDPRFPRNRFQDGEFVGIMTTVNRAALELGQKDGRYFNVEHVKPKGMRSSMWGLDAVVEPSEGVGMERPDEAAITQDINGTVIDVYRAIEWVIEIIPSVWGVGSSSYPEKWVFSCTDDFSVVFEARPLGHLHNQFPLAYLELEPEGYAQYSRGMADIYRPVQQTLDWLVNSHFYNVRQGLNNQWLFDPTRVYEKDLERDDPGKAIRLKPAAYGSDVRTALMQLPVANLTQSHLNDMAMMYQMGDRLGINDQVMGMESPSSRRTAQEIRGNQSFAISRLKVLSEYFSATGWSQLSDMLVANSQQFYTGEQKFKLAGETASLAGEQFLNVTPEDITGQFGYIPVDGTLPVDRFAQANLWRQLLTDMTTVPGLLQQYDLGRIFAYVAQLSGLKNVSRFKIDVMSDQAMLQSAAAGNSVPMGGAEGLGNPMEPGQVPGMGPTA